MCRDCGIVYQIFLFHVILGVLIDWVRSQTVFTGIPILELSEKESKEWLKRALELIYYTNRDVGHMPGMVYYEQSEEENEEWVRSNYRHQRCVKRYNQQYFIKTKLKRFHLSSSQRDHFHRLLNSVTRVQLEGHVKFIKSEYVFKRIFERKCLYEHAEKCKTVSGKSKGEEYDKNI
ncbi:hypothetical protein CHS0354_001481 [Potamilus streckersoni]|uniref:Uncharacterized protein n=1 Tax=Potamilus streckersoni TaxID=2493646 RepID=A0AAE0S2B8_9BIVA|nr:hypothetical protein CHS0354_001481 [Potamilus streckersoni]